jgi:hypothetical protein
MPLNPFKVKAGLKLIKEAGVEIGDLCTITWKLDGGSFTGQEMSHTGPMTKLEDGWLELNPTERSPGHLRLPVTALLNVSKISIEATKKSADFANVDDIVSDDGHVKVDSLATNPFIRKAQQNG